MLFPEDTSLWVWAVVGVISIAAAFLPLILVSGNRIVSLRCAAWVSLLTAATAYASIQQMLHYPLKPRLEGPVPFWESAIWADVGSIVGFPVAILAMGDLGDSETRVRLLAIAALLWSFVIGLATMGVLIVLGHISIMRRPLVEMGGETPS
jgi:hypothetical protein